MSLVSLVFGEHGGTGRRPVEVHVACQEVLLALFGLVGLTVGNPIPVTIIPSPRHPEAGSSSICYEGLEALVNITVVVCSRTAVTTIIPIV